MLEQPLSLNKYGYGHGDPVNHTDPSGRFTLVDTIKSLTIYEKLFALALGTYAGSKLYSTLQEAGAFPPVTIPRIPGLANLNKTRIQLQEKLEWQIARATAVLCAATNTICKLPGYPAIVWGNDLPQTTSHIFNSITGNGNYKPNPDIQIPQFFLNAYRVFLLYKRPGWSRRGVSPNGSDYWYNYEPQCNTRVTSGLTCDEYPFASVWVAGYPGYQIGVVSIRLVPNYEQLQGFPGSQFYKLGQFYSTSGLIPNHAIKGWFGSASSFAYPSFWITSKGETKEFTGQARNN